MEKYIWGRITWYMFHTIAARIKEEYFPLVRSVLLDFIRQISYNLPCPICAHHAKQHLSRVNFNVIQTKTDFRNFLFAFHNRVNQDLNKPMESIDILKKYDNANVDKMLEYFIHVHNHETYSEQLMMRKHMKNTGIKNFVNWYATNKHMFEV